MDQNNESSEDILSSHSDSDVPDLFSGFDDVNRFLAFKAGSPILSLVLQEYKKHLKTAKALEREFRLIPCPDGTQENRFERLRLHLKKVVEDIEELVKKCKQDLVLEEEALRRAEMGEVTMDEAESSTRPGAN